ncbi:CHAT domain-containing protein, partial [Hypoxylon sp. NC1633]
LDDLNRAIDISERAMDATPQDYPDRAFRLNNIGGWLGRRFERTGSIDDLNRAIDISERVVDATPQDHPDRAAWLNNFGAWLGRRFEREGSINDLNRAIDITYTAIDATPQDHPNRAFRLNNIGGWLGRRFERTGSIDDLNRAIDMANMAVGATPQDHPDRALRLNNFGILIGRRFEQSGSTDDLNRLISSSKEGWSCHSASPSTRIILARRAAIYLILQWKLEKSSHLLREAVTLQWKLKESSHLLREAVNLLPIVSPRSSQHTDKQHVLADFAGLASMAAAMSLNAAAMSLNPAEGDKEEKAYDAVKLLELGRGVIASLLMDMRADVSDLSLRYPDLAGEFLSLRDELDSPAGRSLALSPSDSPTSWESQAKRRREADLKFSELVTTIRTKPEFHNFLLPPTRDELMAAANPDPIVVVNLSGFRCDAFIIEHDQIRALNLSSLTLKKVQEYAQQLRSSPPADMAPMLEWLWEAVCRPCLNALGFTGNYPSSGNPPHVWWIPTGPLSKLPLHAAGIHVPGSTETVLDRVMSSFAPSIRALIHGRQRRPRDPSRPPSDHALLIAMSKTPGLSTNRILPSVQDEVEMLSGLCPALKLQAIRPPLRKADVLKHLEECKIFHFAGHGKTDPMEPSQSQLLLEDWESDPLTVGDLRDHKLQDNPPFLSYLSACSTGSNQAENLEDEGIHLVSAFQLAGFRHVVGTLWEVVDAHCVEVARVLYETLRDEGMTDYAVCLGLHRAVKKLRDREVDKGSERAGRPAILLMDSETEQNEKVGGMMNYYWVPFVHFGV